MSSFGISSPRIRESAGITSPLLSIETSRHLSPSATPIPCDPNRPRRQSGIRSVVVVLSPSTGCCDWMDSFDSQSLNALDDDEMSRLARRRGVRASSGPQPIQRRDAGSVRAYRGSGNNSDDNYSSVPQSPLVEVPTGQQGNHAG